MKRSEVIMLVLGTFSLLSFPVSLFLNIPLIAFVCVIILTGAIVIDLSGGFDKR